jgi:hypothetical protein
LNWEEFAPTDIRWLASFSASCLHAADATRRGQLIVDQRLADAVNEPARELRRQVSAAGLPVDRFWRCLLGLSSELESNFELATAALRKAAGQLAGREGLVGVLAGCIGDLEAAVRSVIPDMVDELALRGTPLRDQWEARGPGLLREIGRWTDPLVIAPNADVVLVQPAIGGGGCAFLLFNRVHFEAVLVNPIPQLPEVLRLSWLLSQLQLDVPHFGEAIHADRLPLVAGLAMLPVVLRAAETVELATWNRDMLALAIQAWHVPVRDIAEMLDILDNWWGTYLENRPAWRVAMAALDRMLDA